MQPAAVLENAIVAAVKRNALSDVKKSLYENFRAEIEQLLKRLPGEQWQGDGDHKDCVTIEGSAASGTALEDGDVDITIWTHFRITRSMRRQFVEAMQRNSSGWFTLLGSPKIGFKAVQLDMNAGTEQQADVSGSQTATHYTADDSRHLLVDIACDGPEHTKLGKLSCDIVFANAKFGNAVARPAEPGMYPLPDVVCTVVRLFKIAKAAGAPGLCKVKGYAWDALVTRRYELYKRQVGREPSVVELTLQVLTAFPDEATFKFNATDLIMALEDQVFEAMCDKTAERRVPRVYFSSILSNGDFESAGNTATRIKKYLVALMAMAQTGCQVEELAERLEQFLKTAWKSGVCSSQAFRQAAKQECDTDLTDTATTGQGPTGVPSQQPGVCDGFTAHQQAGLPELAYSRDSEIKDRLPELELGVQELLLKQAAQHVDEEEDDSDDSTQTDSALVSSTHQFCNGLTDYLSGSVTKGDRGFSIQGPRDGVLEYVLNYKTNGGMALEHEIESLGRCLFQLKV